MKRAITNACYERIKKMTLISKKLFDIFCLDGYACKLAYLSKLTGLDCCYPQWWQGFYNGAFARASDMSGECYCCIDGEWILQKEAKNG
jgi:hypothetical protein